MARPGLVLALVLSSAAIAHAGTVDVISSDPELAREAQGWFASRGHAAPSTHLDAQRTATLRDCLVIEEPACALAVVNDHAQADAVVYIQVDEPPSKITIHWLPKHGSAEARNDSCAGCSRPQIRAHVLQQLATLSSAASSAPPASGGQVSSSSASGAPSRTGLAVGIEVGEPTSATAAWFMGKLALVGGLGTGTFDGLGIALRAGAQLEVARLAPAVALRVGLGVRHYHHGYRTASVDELPDTHTGAFASVSANLDSGPLQLYAELAPGVDLRRTRSCTLASGPDTICPHAQEAPVFVHFMVGVRWFLPR